MNYTIDPVTFAISIFNDGETVPFQFQPDYPNGDPFDSVAEAEAWAQASIAAHDPACLVWAPNGKGLAGEPKISAANQAKATLIASGKAKLIAGTPLTADETNALWPTS